jgi:DNA-directed RNA polymerase subunit H (RpoH/RPB5)
MEDKAIETLQTMLGQRGIDTKTERINTDALDKTNLYTIGKILVVFSQKDKGILDRDVKNFLEFANSNEYSNGIIIVALVPPSENVLKSIKSKTKETPLQFFHIRQLLFDITRHRLAMPHRILKEEERVAVMKKYNVVNPAEQLPWIDSQDAMVKWIGGRPGDIIEVTRHSDVAGTQLYYRYCVPDVNVA